MPGDYLFPKRLFKSGEPLDTVELNDALQVAAERLNGHLGPHNIRAPLDPALSAAAGTFFRTKVATVDVDPLMDNAAGSSPGASPQPEAADAFLLEQETGWQPIRGSEDMIIEVSTGASSLALTAQATHCYAGKYDGSNPTYKTIVPTFRDPELRNGKVRKEDKARLKVTLTFDSGDISQTFSITDARNFTDLSDQSLEIAEKIAASQTFNQDYIVLARGSSLRFISKSPGTPSTLRLIRYESVAPSPVINKGDALTLEADTNLPSVSDAFSSLDSCDDASDPEVVIYYAAQIQYAFRVDGVVITETITGRFDNEQAPLTPARILEPRNDDAVSPGSGISGPLLGRFRERPDAINIPMFSVRLTASVDVEPGDHVVELVVRRVPTGRRRSFTPPPPEVGGPVSGVIYTPAENRVYIYSRQMAVTDVPIEPIDSAEFGNPAVVSSFHDEDVVTKKALVDERLQRVANEINDIQSFQIARGAINGDHLEGFSSVLSTGSSENLTTPTIRSVDYPYAYPTLGARAFSDSLDLYDVNSLTSPWYMLDAAVLSSALDGTSTALNCVLTVEANVFIKKLVHENVGRPNQSQMHLSAAAFMIGLYDADEGKYFLFRPSLAWVNSNNYIAYQRNKTSDKLSVLLGLTSATKGLNYLSEYDEAASGDVPGDFVDVPVTAYIDFSGEDAAGNSRALKRRVTLVAIFASTAWMGSDSSDGPAICVPSSVTINAVAMKS